MPPSPKNKRYADKQERIKNRGSRVVQINRLPSQVCKLSSTDVKKCEYSNYCGNLAMQGASCNGLIQLHASYSGPLGKFATITSTIP